MLTDIFAERYSKQAIWTQFTETEAKLLVQCFRLVAEDVIPYWTDGKVSEPRKRLWHSIHDRLSRELGVHELAPLHYSYQTVLMGQQTTVSGSWTMDQVCKTFMTSEYLPHVSADRFVKERLSFVELAFRMREEEVNRVNTALAGDSTAAELQRALLSFNNRGEAVRASIDQFRKCVDELNERLRRVSAPLHYHNGFIQISEDALIQDQIEKPFWNAVADPIWKNVDIDMKEALDRRDTAGRDPAFYAAKALESTIKVISDCKKWSRGGERGASAYVDNLGSAKNGRFIADWEREALKGFFTAVRNPLGHGPGGEEMPQLTPAQTDWAIQTCMSWIKTLIARLNTPPI